MYDLSMEVQACKTLHGHLLFWIEKFAKIRRPLFDNRDNIGEAAREEKKNYINMGMHSL